MTITKASASISPRRRAPCRPPSLPVWAQSRICRSAPVYAPAARTSVEPRPHCAAMRPATSCPASVMIIPSLPAPTPYMILSSTTAVAAVAVRPYSTASTLPNTGQPQDQTVACQHHRAYRQVRPQRLDGHHQQVHAARGRAAHIEQRHPCTEEHARVQRCKPVARSAAAIPIHRGTARRTPCFAASCAGTAARQTGS